MSTVLLAAFLSVGVFPLSTGPNAPSQVPLVLLEDISNVYGDVEIDRNKHIHKKRKLAEGREKTMVILSDIIVNGLYVYGLLEMNL